MSNSEQVDKVMDMVDKIGNFLSSKGQDLLTLLKERGKFGAIPTKEELQQSENDLEYTLEAELLAIFDKFKGVM